MAISRSDDPYRNPVSVVARLVIALMAMPIGTVACDPGPEGVADSVQFRDSAGVRIVEYEGPPSGVPVWSVEDDVEFVLGSVTQEAQFGNVVSVVEFSDGSIVVADGQARELLAFGTSGESLWTAGGSGEGPGEFTRINGLFRLPSDSLLVIDGSLGRASVFDRSGRFIRQFAFEEPPADLTGVQVAGVLDDGRSVGWRTRLSSGPEEPGAYRLSLVLEYYDQEGSALLRVAELPGGDRVMQVTDPGWTVQGEAVWGRKTEMSPGRGGVAVTTQDRWEVMRYDGSGSLDMVVRVRAPARVTDRSVRAELARHDLAGGDHLPDTLPAVGRIHLDTEGRLWVEEFVLPYLEDEASWWVFDQDGFAIARVYLVPRFSPHHVTSDHVLGVRLDDFDVPVIERRRIDKP